jgi:murein DD-endopeptidase MepM/ murein hydrolase activator NlpD
VNSWCRWIGSLIALSSLVLLVSSCSRLSPTSSPSASVATSTPAIKPAFIPPPVSKITIMPGEVTRLVLPYDPRTEQSVKLKCQEREVPLTKIAGELVAFLSETYFSKGEEYRCSLYDKGYSRQVALVTVGKKEYKKEFLKVDKKRVSLSKKDLARVGREQRVLNVLYRNQRGHLLFEEMFLAPLKSKITSIYGTKRIYNGNKKGQHLGTDFRAAVGTPIVAANSGEVVLARDLFFTGNTVIIYHGLSIFTVYGHLSKLLVSPGDRVLREDRIGLSGVTGRVTGPHLHWGVKVNGNWVDGFSLIRETAAHDSSEN